MSWPRTKEWKTKNAREIRSPSESMPWKKVLLETRGKHTTGAKFGLRGWENKREELTSGVVGKCRGLDEIYLKISQCYCWLRSRLSWWPRYHLPCKYQTRQFDRNRNAPQSDDSHCKEPQGERENPRDVLLIVTETMYRDRGSVYKM